MKRIERDHYPRYAPPLVDNSHKWRDKANPQLGEWEHVCTSGECPIGHYYVTAMDGPSWYYMAGPYATHAEALALVDKARDLADKHDRVGIEWQPDFKGKISPAFELPVGG